MGSRKSRSEGVNADEIRFLLNLYRKLLSDFSRRYPKEAKSFEKDFLTIESRVQSEGLSFLTKILPRLGKAIDASFDSGLLQVPTGILKMSRKRPAVPALLQGLLSKVYTSDGRLGWPEPAVIQDIRQFCYMLYKYKLPYSEKQVTDVIDGFVTTECELGRLEVADDELIAHARSLIGDVLSGFDPKDVLPKHGPGAVATGEKLEEKWEFSRLYDSIHQVYPYYDYFIVGRDKEVLDRVRWYRGLTRTKSGQAKVVLVPKDSRGPRLISMEPLEYQWIQQGFNRALVSRLQSHRLTRGHINFKDQSVNRDLARESSQHHFFATLDLKDASDRVSLQLVKMLFPEHITRCLEAIRTTATLLPDGRVVELRKFAPMGSAVCFSVEALVFWAICTSAVALAQQLSYRDAAGLVYVYGDDIIVPTGVFEVVVEALERVGLRVNKSKCFHRGDFRESCGMDAYDGVDVTPTRVSTRWSDSPSSGACLASYASYGNSLRRKGYDQLADFIFGALRSVHGKIPFGITTSGYPCEVVDSSEAAVRANAQIGIPSRINKELHRIEFRVKTLAVARVPSQLDGWERLLRDFTQGCGTRPDEVVLPRHTKVRRAWRPVGYHNLSPAVKQWIKPNI